MGLAAPWQKVDPLWAPRTQEVLGAPEECMECTSAEGFGLDVVVEVIRHSVVMVQEGVIGQWCWVTVTTEPFLGTWAV
jgi:hypothetical protein